MIKRVFWRIPELLVPYSVVTVCTVVPTACNKRIFISKWCMGGDQCISSLNVNGGEFFRVYRYTK